MSFQSQLERDAERVVSDYNSGVGMHVIAERYGCNSGTVWYFLKKRGVTTRPRTSMDKPGAEYLPEIIRLHAENKSAYAIAKELGMCKATVLSLLEKAGLSTSHKNKQRADPLKNHVDEIVAGYLAGESTCQLAERFQASSSAIWRAIDEAGVECRSVRQYERDDSFFSVIDTEEKAYVLGWFYSDGNNMKGGVGVRLQIADKEMLERIRDLMGYTGPFHLRQPRLEHHKPLWGMVIHSKQLSRDLAALGCPEAKSFLVKFPPPEIVPAHLVRHFVRGVFDGDGSFGCYGKARRWRVQITGTHALMSGIPEAAGVHGILVQYDAERNINTWNLMIHRLDDIKKFLDWLYMDTDLFLERKHAAYLAFLASRSATAVAV